MQLADEIDRHQRRAGNVVASGDLQDSFGNRLIAAGRGEQLAPISKIAAFQYGVDRRKRPGGVMDVPVLHGATHQ
ncbi:MAG TPA: hypothetical protein VHC70_10475 [Phycisphaerales bacterium]|nr:hypothetical protein [Phycisphaerales bacterium]